MNFPVPVRRSRQLESSSGPRDPVTNSYKWMRTPVGNANPADLADTCDNLLHLLLDHAARDAIAGVTGWVGHEIVGFGVDHPRGTDLVEK